MSDQPGEWNVPSDGHEDRRSGLESRLVTTLLIGRLVAPTTDVVCRVRNLSNNGARVETTLQLNRDDRVQLELRGTNLIEARVAWSKDGACGLHFLSPVDANTLLKPTSKQAGWSVRLPRLEAACPIIIVANGYNIPAMLRDINQRGIRVDGVDRLLPPGAITVQIPKLGSAHMGIRWQREDAAGLQCVKPFQFEPLSHWLMDHDTRFARRT